MLRILSSFAALMLATPLSASALEGARQTYMPPPPAVSSGSIVQIILSLLLVLAAIVLVAWLLKRMNLVQQNTAGHLKMIGSIAIGQRERVVLLEIDKTWLVVGVGPGQIRTLHTHPKPEGDERTAKVESIVPATFADNKFAAMLASVVNRRPTGRTPDAP